MKISEKKETIQTFEFGKEEVIECFSTYLKSKGAVIPEKAQFSFDIKIGPTTRDVEMVKITTKFVEEGPTNGRAEAL